jgi:hypothetical protein
MFVSARSRPLHLKTIRLNPEKAGSSSAFTAHPGEYFPRASGLRFRYDKTRPMFDVVTAIELGDLDRTYRAIDISGNDERLYSLTCPLYLGIILAAIPKYTKGKLTRIPKNKDGQPLALDRGARRAWRQLGLPIAAAGRG